MCVSGSIISSMNLKVLPKDSVICSCSARLGVCAIVKAILITNQTFIGLVPNGGIVNEFLFYILSYNAKRLNDLSSGTTISYLSRSEFEKFEIPVPSLLEQKRIADLLSKLDNQIETNKLILENYVKFKKGLMQKIFL